MSINSQYTRVFISQGEKLRDLCLGERDLLREVDREDDEEEDELEELLEWRRLQEGKGVSGGVTRFLSP